jgi:hypothetical protein
MHIKHAVRQALYREGRLAVVEVSTTYTLTFIESCLRACNFTSKEQSGPTWRKEKRGKITHVGSVYSEKFTVQEMS